jgi:DNA invertase Pin-like site-specific DNA recombinase
MNCVTYARVSTEKQAERELSLPAQQQAMRDFATHQHWPILEEFVEAGASARTVERPVLKKLLSRLRQPPKIDVVLVHKIDRLARNVFDHATIRALLKQRGIRLVSVVESVDDSVSGQLVENIMASIAEFYSANLGEEVKKGMSAKVQRGEWPHLPPRGYRMQRGQDGRSRPVPDEREAALVQEAFELYATGCWSFLRLGDELAKRGFLTKAGKPVPASYINEMLTNPFYIGRIRWKGAERPGVHTPLVSEELFLKVAGMLGERKKEHRERYGKLRFFLRGVARCGSCGNNMTAERHGRFAYYRCCRNAQSRARCRSRFSNVQEIHAQIRILYRQLRLDPKLVSAIEDAAIQTIKDRQQAASRRQSTLRILHNKAESRLNAAAEAYASGTMAEATFKTLSSRAAAELKDIESELKLCGVDYDREINRVRSSLSGDPTLWTLHDGRKFDAQKVLLHQVFIQIVLDHNSVVGYQLQAPFDQVLRRYDGVSSFAATASTTSVELGDAPTQLATIFA